jgi:hypothetical protein
VPAPEVCTNGVDDDCDGAPDCADPDCSDSPACCVPAPEVCFDGTDQDCDGLVGCDDPDCSSDPRCCVPTGPEACFNFRDDDCDGLRDCDDPDCRRDPRCCVPDPGGEVCSDGRDNDCDRRPDCLDPDCFGDPVCTPDGGPIPVDGGAMCVPNAPAEGTLALCTDGRDNECDGATDCDDTDCSPFGDSVGECCNGIDDNGNGFPDEFACRCRGDGDCASGGPIPQVCWSTLFGVCAPRCDLLGGDTFCQMLDPSLRCSIATGECLF